MTKSTPAVTDSGEPSGPANERTQSRPSVERRDALVACSVLAVLGVAYVAMGMAVKSLLVLGAAAFCGLSVYLARRRTGRSKPVRRSGKGRKKRRKR